MARHPGVESLLGWLEPDLPNMTRTEGEVASHIHQAALEVAELIPQDTPELTAGLRKLLEAQDCLLRAHHESGRLTG